MVLSLFYRQIKSDYEKHQFSICRSKVNLKFEIVLDLNGLPYIFLLATKSIKAGEVGWLDYGDAYWSHWRGGGPPRDMGAAALVQPTAPVSQDVFVRSRARALLGAEILTIV
jgi:hypothetical protein